MAWRCFVELGVYFQIRFENVVVQGIRMEYDEMGRLLPFLLLLHPKLIFLKIGSFKWIG
jgi:hypothetical protein